MTRRRFVSLLWLVVATAPAGAADRPPQASSVAAEQAAATALRSGDTLALLGGTLIERMQHQGHLEAVLQCAAPDLQLRVRNIGWSGDDVHGTARAGFEPPAAGYGRLMRDLRTADPTVVLVAYGFAEASSVLPSSTASIVSDNAAATAAAERFKAGLRRLVGDLQGADKQRGDEAASSDKNRVRVLLLRPFLLPGVRTPAYAQAMQRCQQAVDAVASDLGVSVLDASLDPVDNVLFTDDGLNPSDRGYAQLARQLAADLVGTAPADCSAERLAALRQKISEKNQLFFHRYRPQNETYLFLFRKHEQGNNAVEIPQFDPLVEQADAAIWQMAKDAAK